MPVTPGVDWMIGWISDAQYWTPRSEEEIIIPPVLQLEQQYPLHKHLPFNMPPCPLSQGLS